MLTVNCLLSAIYLLILMHNFTVILSHLGMCEYVSYHLHLQDSVPKSAFIEERLRRIKAEKRAESKVDLDTKGILLRNFVQFYVESAPISSLPRPFRFPPAAFVGLGHDVRVKSSAKDLLQDHVDVLLSMS